MILNSRNPITIYSFVILMIFLVGLWIIGHSIQEGESKNETLLFNEQKWASNKPSQYSYIVSSGCMWVNSYKVEKTESGLFSISLDSSPIIQPMSISDLFIEVRRANLTSNEVSTKYHPYFGFPTLIDVDWEKEVIDDECFFQVKEFKVLDSNET